MSYSITEGNASALISAFTHDGLSVEEQSKIRLLSHVYVPKEHRRKGEATKLLNKITEESDQAGLALMIEVNPYDDEQITVDDLKSFYEKHGFFEIQSEPCVMLRAVKQPDLTPKKSTVAILDAYGNPY